MCFETFERPRGLGHWVTVKKYVTNCQSFQSLTKEKDKVRVKYNFPDDLLCKHFYEGNSELDSRYRIVNAKSSLGVNISFWQEICANKNVVNVIRDRYKIQNPGSKFRFKISKLLCTNRIAKTSKIPSLVNPLSVSTQKYKNGSY